MDVVRGKLVIVISKRCVYTLIMPLDGFLDTRNMSQLNVCCFT